MTAPAKKNPFGGGPKKAMPGKAAPAKTAPAATEAADADEDAAPATLSAKGQRKDPFALGSEGGSDYAVKDFLDELLLVRPHTLDAMTTTVSKGKEQDYVVCDIYRLETPDEETGEPEFIEDFFIFQTVLYKKFKKVLQGPNEWALGRVYLGQARGGNNAPYLFGPPTEEEITAAYAFAQEKGLQL